MNALSEAQGTPLPYTGQEFFDGLDDGREVWIYGERVRLITRHPAFRNSARMLARLYDALHADHARGEGAADLPHRMGRLQPSLLRRSPHCRGTGGRARRDRRLGPAELWLGYDWLGRPSDYKATFLATLGANAEFYAPYHDNAQRWYRFSQERGPFFNQAIIHPPVDRSMAGGPGAPTGMGHRSFISLTGLSVPFPTGSRNLAARANAQAISGST